MKDVFAPPEGSEHEPRASSAFCFVMVAVLSFTRGVQRLFEQSWELEPMSVRNTFNGLLWIGGLTLYLGVSGLIHDALGRSQLELSAALLSTPLSAVFLVWSGRVLSAKRLTRQELMPFGILGAVLLALYSVGATVYVPHFFSSYATRYGVIGAVFAMISALFFLMVIIVVSAAAGREIRDELDRIRRGEGRPRTRSSASGTRSPARRGCGGRRCGTDPGAPGQTTRGVMTVSSSVGDAVR